MSVWVLLYRMPRPCAVGRETGGADGRPDGEPHVGCSEEIKGETAEAAARAFRKFHVRLSSPCLELSAQDRNGIEGAVR